MVEPETEAVGPAERVGRYALYGRLAAGGMATVHLGRLAGPTGFTRAVAVKRLHPQFCKDPEFVAMFIDEARLAARIKHPNVVATLDILTMGQELLLVMEYIRGECFSKLLRAARRKNLEPSIGVVGSVAAGMLHGLHAAHEATDEQGEFLNVVHRDVSPQNVMVGTDGVARVLDFGVAKASARIQITRDGQMKGKLSYMSPEQLQGIPVDRRADVFAAGVVIWEALTRRRLFVGEDASDVLRKILKEEVPPPSEFVPGLSPELDQVVLRALCKDPERRYQNAREVALDIERIIDLASPEEVGQWVSSVAGEVLAKREAMLTEIESLNEEQVAQDAAEGGASTLQSYGSVSDSHTFDRIQSWAGAHRSSQPPPEEEIDEIEFVETVADARCIDGSSIPPPFPTGYNLGVGDTSVTPITASHLHEEARVVAQAPDSASDSLRASSASDSLRASGSTDRTSTGPRAVVAQLGEAPAPPRRRGLTWLLAAVALAVVAGVGFIELRHSKLVVADGSLSLVPRSAPTLPPPSVEDDTPEESAADKDDGVEAAEGPRLAQEEAIEAAIPNTGRGASRLASATPTDKKPAARPTGVKPTASTYALTPAPKAAPARARKQAPPPAPRPAAAAPAASSAEAKKKEECREPYWFDNKGIKRLRLDCL